MLTTNFSAIKYKHNEGCGMSREIKAFFDQEKYVVIREFLSLEMCNILYRYCLMRTEAIKYKKEKSPECYNKKWDGEFSDETLDQAFASYGDPMGDSLLELSLKDIEFFTGKRLLPNYSYWQLYMPDGELVKHTDRPSCELSTTICLGYDFSNLAGNYVWPINFKKYQSEEEVSIVLNPGDMIVYQGCNLIHWRDKFLGVNQAQMFLHYSDADGPYKKIFDDRDLLGVAAGLN